MFCFQVSFVFILIKQSPPGNPGGSAETKFPTFGLVLVKLSESILYTAHTETGSLIVATPLHPCVFVVQFSEPRIRSILA